MPPTKEKDNAFANALPPAALKGLGSLHFPKSGKAPIFGSGDLARTLHISPGVTSLTQTASTVAPPRLKMGQAALVVASFLDELEKIASDGGLSAEELELFKEAFIGPTIGMARRALGSGASALGGALERGGMGGASRMVHAFNAPIETGAAGRALVGAGQHISSTASPGVLGGLRHGVGEAIAHKGHGLAGGGLGAVGKATWSMVNPVGTAAEAGLTGVGHMASRAAGLAPTSMGHKLLTKAMPRAGEILGGAGTSAAIGAPVGAAGLLGHHAMGALGRAAPALADVAGHAAGALGESGAELAHHVGADVLGTHGHGVLQKMRGLLPGAARAA